MTVCRLPVTKCFIIVGSSEKCLKIKHLEYSNSDQGIDLLSLASGSSPIWITMTMDGLLRWIRNKSDYVFILNPSVVSSIESNIHINYQFISQFDLF